MFSKDDQREHEKIIANIEAKSSLISELLKKANLSKLVILKSQILKLDFIIKVSDCTKHSDQHSASIEYFDFDFSKSYCSNSTKIIWVEQSDMSFEEVLEAVKNAK